LINEKERPMLFNVIYGLGGRDFTAYHAEEVFKKAKEYAEKGEVTEREVWVGVRE